MSPAPSDRSRRRTVINIALAVMGGFVLVATVRQVGWADVRSGLTQIGWWFPVAVLLGGFRFAARARAWMACAMMMTRGTHSAPGTPHSALRTSHFFGAVVAADALGNLTPLGVLASEPAKIILVRNQISTLAAIASVAAENAFYLVSVVVVVAAGAAIFINGSDLSDGLRLGVQGVLIGAVGGGLVAVLIARHQPAVLSRLAHWISAVTGRRYESAHRLEEIEAHVYGILQWPLRDIARVAGWHGVFHVAAVAEVFLVLRLLPGGNLISLVDAFVIETAGRLIAVVFKVVPYRLGVDEAGMALVARALAPDVAAGAVLAAAGVTLALVRRLRILCWNAIGLLVLVRR